MLLEQSKDFDFSQEEDQKQFEELPEVAKDTLIDKAKDNAILENESLLEHGEEQKESIVEQIKKEGEVVVFRLFQAFEKITGGEHHPELLRKILLLPKEPVVDMESYHKQREEEFLSWALGPLTEAAYGTVSLGVRKAVEGILKASTEFNKKLAEFSDKAAKRFADAKTLYGIKEKNVDK
jgi:hypothetical protein